MTNSNLKNALTAINEEAQIVPGNAELSDADLQDLSGGLAMEDSDGGDCGSMGNTACAGMKK